MDRTAEQADFFRELGRELRQVWASLRDAWSSSGVALRNQLRLLRQLRLDYVVMPVGGPLPERTGPPRSFIQRQLPLPADPLSLEALNHRLSAIADAANVKGVVFVFRGFSAGLAALQNFRRSMQRLRAAGKEVVVYTPYLDLPHYFAATAASRIVVPPNATFSVLGLHSETIFLKDALARLGIEADVIQISPYKDAYNLFDKADVTPEQRQQIEWLLDDIYDSITAAMAEGRGKSQAEIQALIDRAPLFGQEAQDQGLVDVLAYEDNLAYLLAEAPPGEPPQHPVANERRPKATLASWPKAHSLLLEVYRRPTMKYIGVISLEGAIVMGPSRQPPINLPIPVPLVGGTMAGEETLSQMLRQAERDPRLAALIFHVDSNGGSSQASDLIWRQVQRIAQKKPVLAYLGNVAASGGYYVSAGASHIMGQSLSITGSIGVLSLHLSTRGLYDRVGVHRVSFQRGEHAGLYSDWDPLSPEERQIYWDAVVDTYEKFKQVVSAGRELALDSLDPISGGRVWTGRQALDHRLVDSQGDFLDAACRAADMAGLPVDNGHRVPLVNIYAGQKEYLLPEPYHAARELTRWLSLDDLRRFLGQPLMLMPLDIKFW